VEGGEEGEGGKCNNLARFHFHFWVFHVIANLIVIYLSQ